MSDPNKTVTMYCVKCRHKVAVRDPQPVTLKSGRKAMKGKCPHCGTNTYVIV